MVKFKPIFLNLLKMKGSWLYLAFGVFPLILFIVAFFNTNFMQLSGEKHSLSFLEFFSSVFVIQNNAVIPLVILTYIIGLNFYSEKVKGQLYFYKDLPRMKLFNSKLLSLLVLYFLFIIVLFVSSLILYYLHINNMDLSAHQFFPNNQSDVQYVFIEFFGTFFVQILCILLAILLSISLPNGYTILGVIGFYILSSIAPFLKSLKFVFPNGYQEKLTYYSFGSIFFVITLIFLVYAVIFYVISLYKFNKLEY
ncbi:hypothetical protein DOS77_00775 [Staphylococcus felis]|uniref:hypothetical protein n=1 Tax=Staphylococcus felis TaxID=46127 RepID=UPI000E23F8E9|nr:hypothetical protein [Staphylococcus felis]REH95040.1 hypothetical protein DOS67_08105 [Staphylococcus felis]REI03473.1 hypothetical protein DOS65_04700 [Staphylococcus felis]REI08463.1 hypothetical protein DOS66_09020 [Staphylococcus felis]REI25460.1 hypothetical protein DOS77_00775 [Staphylococcus felis]REI33225.1 hypothetical protein DOS82_07315 [Staphylococcus felis]